MAFEVVLTPDFKKELKHIAKKHRHILNDVQKLIAQLAVNPKIGSDLGQGIYKLRIAISGTSKGKSGGARVITYLKIQKETIILVDIYLKSEFDTVSTDMILDKLKDQGFI